MDGHARWGTCEFEGLVRPHCWAGPEAEALEDGDETAAAHEGEGEAAAEMAARLADGNGAPRRRRRNPTLQPPTPQEEAAAASSSPSSPPPPPPSSTSVFSSSSSSPCATEASAAGAGLRDAGDEFVGVGRPVGVEVDVVGVGTGGRAGGRVTGDGGSGGGGKGARGWWRHSATRTARGGGGGGGATEGERTGPVRSSYAMRGRARSRRCRLTVPRSHRMDQPRTVEPPSSHRRRRLAAPRKQSPPPPPPSTKSPCFAAARGRATREAVVVVRGDAEANDPMGGDGAGGDVGSVDEGDSVAGGEADGGDPGWPKRASPSTGADGGDPSWPRRLNVSALALPSAARARWSHRRLATQRPPPPPKSEGLARSGDGGAGSTAA
ncbi:hypothetical protein DAI22_03g342301 [Oryza sativa Japonica Group]|nr:hypothetical protein DAI22_03g342301 [Oryza sativa Japonica Group]